MRFILSRDPDYILWIIRTPVARSRQPTSASVQAVQELLRIVTATRDSQEIERQRRLAWEQEQEQKYAQKQADLEKLIIDMRQEISMLRSMGNTEPLDRSDSTISSVSPISQYSSDMYPPFIQGSSTDPFAGGPAYGNDVQEELQSVSPGMSPPYLTCVRPSQLHESSPLPANQKKRATSEVSSEDEEETLSSDGSSSRPVKRVNHHDKRCLTIHVSRQNSVLYSHSHLLRRPYGSTYYALWRSKMTRTFLIVTQNANQ